MIDLRAVSDEKDLEVYIRVVSNELEEQFHFLGTQAPQEVPVGMLWSAMNYSLSSGGKRLRPVLCIMAAEAFGAPLRWAMPLAVAHEMIHAASLIHDDLPCMDNDDLRRGKPTNHKVYGEALALLAGDALLAWAFEHAIGGLLNEGVPSDWALRAVLTLAIATGPLGICGGQSMDMGFEALEKLPEDEQVMEIAKHKTGVLIASAVEGGAILAGAGTHEIARMRNYGMCLGLAFQVADDILDVVGNTEDIGKTAGKDVAQGKMTFVAVHGLDGARRILHDMSNSAKEWVEGLPCAEAFKFLVDKMMRRTR